LELVELAERLGVEARVVEGQPDLVGGGLQERQLGLVERLERLAAERQGAQDVAAAVDRHAYEAEDRLAPAGGPGARRGVRVLVVPVEPDRLAGEGDPSNEPGADGQAPVDLAQARRHAALAAQLERFAVLGQEVQARDLVAGDAGQGVDRGAQDFLDVERAADGLRDRVEDLEMRLDVRAAMRPAASLRRREGGTGAPLQALTPRAPGLRPGDHRARRRWPGAAAFR